MRLRGLPATSVALLVFIAFALLALGGLVLGLGRWESGSAWAVILALGLLVMMLVVSALRKGGGRTAREP